MIPLIRRYQTGIALTTSGIVTTATLLFYIQSPWPWDPMFYMENARFYNGSADSFMATTFSNCCRPRLPALQTCLARPPFGRPLWHGNLTTDTNSLTDSNAILISLGEQQDPINQNRWKGAPTRQPSEEPSSPSLWPSGELAVLERSDIAAQLL